MKLTIVEDRARREWDCPSPMSLSSALALAGRPLALPCGGGGRCGKCRVLARGELSPVTDRERAVFSPGQLQEGWRLACLTRILGEAEVELPREAGPDVLLMGNLGAYRLDPWGKGLGLAVDMGTTTVAAYLYDLSTGGQLSCAAAGNPQAAWGADVISRMEHSLRGKGEGLAGSIRRCLGQLARELCQKAGRELHEIGCGVLTGNSAMLYLLCREPVESIAFAPFLMSRRFGETVLGLVPGLEDRPMYLPPCVSAYVGADITCAILASDLTEQEKPTLLMDVGTNGEMALWYSGALLCCSTAAGPAFEGAGIAMGSLAKPGAVDRVTLEQGRIRLHTIGDLPPASLCGSGLLDAVRVLLDLKYIEPNGRLDTQALERDGRACRLENQPSASLGHGIAITQGDVRAVQLGKAALCAGVDALLHARDLSLSALEALLVAGGFGRHIDLTSAEIVGLIPPGAARLARCIGNAAGAGAVMMLLDQAARSRGEAIAAQARTLELATDPCFAKQYMARMGFETDEL